MTFVIFNVQGVSVTIVAADIHAAIGIYSRDHDLSTIVYVTSITALSKFNAI